MSAGHEHAETFAGMNAAYQRRLMLVTAINVEMIAGQFAGSQALKADALDFFADGITYAVSFWAIGRPVALRSMAALAKGGSLVLMGVWVAATTLYHFFVEGIPEAETMGGIGVLALAANVFTVVLLLPYKDGDANVRSVWLCSRNDAIGNIAVVVAAGAVALFHSGIPDLIVAAAMSALFLSSAWQIIAQAREERRDAAGHGHDHSPNEDHHH
jgi:Co/Zn/Cd efflux system component